MNLLEISKRLSELVEEEARRLSVPVTISVVDIHGNIVLKQRMPGAALISIEMSEGKGLYLSVAAYEDCGVDSFGAAWTTSLYPYLGCGGKVRCTWRRSSAARR